MRRGFAILAAASTFAFPMAAQAVVTVFAVNNGIFTTVSGGGTQVGTLTGTFAIDFGASPTKITALNLVSSASAGFSSITYSDPSTVSAIQGASNNFRVVINSGADTLQLSFTTALTATSGSTIASNSYETQTKPGNRFLTGSVGVTTVPEPAAWGMMVVGFGLIGASIRYGRPKGAVTFD